MRAVPKDCERRVVDCAAADGACGLILFVGLHFGPHSGADAKRLQRVKKDGRGRNGRQRGAGNHFVPAASATSLMVQLHGAVANNRVFTLQHDRGAASSMPLSTHTRASRRPHLTFVGMHRLQSRSSPTASSRWASICRNLRIRARSARRRRRPTQKSRFGALQRWRSMMVLISYPDPPWRPMRYTI